MSKTVFISYANEAMAYSLRRIGRQARRLGIFDDVILYTPKDLPDYVKASPLFKAKRGGGFWCWKPAIIHETLQRLEEGDIVVYIDAGCTLRKSPSQWEQYIRLMDRYDTICFQYDDEQPQWKNIRCTSSRIKHWTKKITLDFIKDYFHNPDVGELRQVLGGILFFKGKENAVLSQWMNLVYTHPELVINPIGDERNDQYPFYIEHRHDQSILTPLAEADEKTLILPEIVEKYRKDSFVWASRIRAASFRDYLPIQIKHYLRILLGNHLFDNIRHKLHGAK